MLDMGAEEKKGENGSMVSYGLNASSEFVIKMERGGYSRSDIILARLVGVSG